MNNPLRASEAMKTAYANGNASRQTLLKQYRDCNEDLEQLHMVLIRETSKKHKLTNEMEFLNRTSLLSLYPDETYVDGVIARCIASGQWRDDPNFPSDPRFRQYWVNVKTKGSTTDEHTDTTRLEARGTPNADQLQTLGSILNPSAMSSPGMALPMPTTSQQLPPQLGQPPQPDTKLMPKPKPKPKAKAAALNLSGGQAWPVQIRAFLQHACCGHSGTVWSVLQCPFAGRRRVVWNWGLAAMQHALWMVLGGDARVGGGHCHSLAEAP